MRFVLAELVSAAEVCDPSLCSEQAATLSDDAIKEEL
jgi:hypothetical protein